MFWIIVIGALFAFSVVGWSFWPRLTDWIRQHIGDPHIIADGDGRFRRNLREILGAITVVMGGLFGAYQFYVSEVNVEKAARIEQKKIEQQQQYSDKQLETENRRIRNDQITKGFDLLGNDNITKRIAGIILLVETMTSSSEDSGRVLDSLCAFVRQQTRVSAASIGQKNGKSLKAVGTHGIHQNTNTPTDIQAALTAIGKHDNEDYAPNISGANIAKADLRGANLKKARLNRVNLMEADLVDANLSDAELSDANLRDADLHRANLSGAKLDGSDLSYVQAGGYEHYENDEENKTNFSDTDLSNSNLSNADLRDTNLKRADLSYAKLRNAELAGADLSNSILIGADLRNADLENADLSDSDLTDTNLSGAKGLSKEQLEAACGNKNTKLPSKLKVKLKTCEEHEDNSDGNE